MGQTKKPTEKRTMIDTIRGFILEAVHQGIEKVKTVSAKLNQLETKRAELETELEQLELGLKQTITDEALLDISVENRMDELCKIGDIKNQNTAIIDILAHLNESIERNQRRLNEEHKEFVGLLREAVINHTQQTRLKINQELSRILAKDQDYSNALSGVCSDILNELHIENTYFQDDGGSFSSESHLITNAGIRYQLSLMCRDTSK